MFEENKPFHELAHDINLKDDQWGNTVDLSQVLLWIHECTSHEEGVMAVRALDAVYEDLGVTEEAAKALVGSWFNCIKDDPELKDEANKWLDDVKVWLNEQTI